MTLSLDVLDGVGRRRKCRRLSSDTHSTHFQRHRKRKWRHDDVSDAGAGTERPREADSAGRHWRQRRLSGLVTPWLFQR